MTTTQQPTLLLVEDRESTREVFGEFLKIHGFNVIFAGDAQEAIEKLKINKKINVVVTDLNMGEGNLDGDYLVGYVCANHPNLPILLNSSTYVDPDQLKTVAQVHAQSLGGSIDRTLVTSKKKIDGPDGILAGIKAAYQNVDLIPPI